MHFLIELGFILSKGEIKQFDSTDKNRLSAEISLTFDDNDTKSKGSQIRAVASIRNTGDAVWLSHDNQIGGVCMGVHLKTDNNEMIDRDWYRVEFPAKSENGVLPGEHIELSFLVPIPDGEGYVLEFDLVSENVTWFSNVGNKTVIYPLNKS